MLFWIIILVLTAAAVMAVLLPLGRAPVAADSDSERDRSVYLGQLRELEKEQAEGRLTAEEAADRRAEIGRRLLASERDGGGGRLRNADLTGRRITAVAALLGIPFVSLTLYLALGSPAAPGQPLSARLAAPAAETDMAVLLRQVEQHLAREPEDGRGWEVIAPVYMRLGRSEEAARAFGNAIRLLGSSPARETGFGEAQVARQGGVVTAEASAAFEKARAADPGAISPRFFLALAKEQEGDAAAAVAGYQSLLKDAPGDAPWRPAVEQALARLQPPQELGAPGAQDIAAAADMSTADRTAMIEGMVDGLAERLRAEPEDVEGWLRLVRSYHVLGRPDEASAAARAALNSVRGDSDQHRIQGLLADLGLTISDAGAP